MEKKYYDEILNLVKNHKRYPGLEDITEAIIEDVYNHAGNIFDELTDVNTIKTYLSKMVSTAMITVPRRLNYNTRRPDAKTAQALENIHKHIEKATESVEIEIFEPKLNLNKETKANENIVDEQFTFEEETTLVEEVVEEQLILEEDASPVEEVVEEQLILEEEASPVEEVVEEQLILEEEAAPIEEVVEEQLILEEEAAPIEEIVEEQLILEEETAPIEEVVEEQSGHDNELNDEDSLTGITHDDMVEKMINGTSDYDLHDNNSDDNLIEDNSDDNNLLELSPDIETIEELNTNTSQEEENDDLTEVIDEQIQDEFDKKTSTGEFIPPKYNQLAFIPENIESDFDINSITTELQNLNISSKDLKILDVYNLKYNQNKSVAEISNILGISSENIILALDKIVGVIKE